MRERFVVALILIGVGAGAACGKSSAPSSDSSANAAPGSIRGHVRLTGTPPENEVIRMRADPQCDRVNNGRRVLNEAVIAAADGSLANVFVQLNGTLPSPPPPSEPVTIDQQGCVYQPRVAGLRLGQPLVAKNSDDLLHNVHGISSGHSQFNFGQPLAGMVNKIEVKEEGILRLQCDVHWWMVAFVGVVNHPYFAVTGPAGTFEFTDVPAGSQTIRAWHEKYGYLTSQVKVEAGQTADVDFTYTGKERAGQSPAGEHAPQ